ncbi:MAG: DNA glycosylase, partial [Nocardioides sp.]|nr:DNA glycosylase [Nocardioides sp.]
MPEGHTLHRLAGELSTTFAGRAVRVTSPQGRFSEAAALLDGSVVTGAEAWGKHLFVAFDDDRFVHVHLGLYGTLLVHPVVEAVPAPVGQVRMRLEAGAPGAASYADPRGATTCALLTGAERAAVVARQGPDP